jgi:hypothetical protein
MVPLTSPMPVPLFAILGGVDGSTGVAVVEVYAID